MVFDNKEWRLKNKEKIKEENKKYYEKNNPMLNQRAKSRYYLQKTDPNYVQKRLSPEEKEKRKTADKKYRAEHRDQINVRQLRYYYKNKERLKEQKKNSPATKKLEALRKTPEYQKQKEANIWAGHKKRRLALMVRLMNEAPTQ